MVKVLFALMPLTLGCEAMAQDKETCENKEVEEAVAAYVYVDLDGSGKLDEIVLTSNPDDDVTIDVVFDVPEKRADEYSSDPDLGLEIKDVNGDKLDDLSLVVKGKMVGLVEVDWALLAKDACSNGDYESDAHIIYRQVDDNFQMGPVYCMYSCEEWREGGTWETGYKRVCVKKHWVCAYVGYEKF